MYKTKYIPLALLVAFSIKTLVLREYSFVDASILFILASITSFFEFKASDQKLKQIEEQNSKDKIELLKLIEQNAKELKEFNTYISSMKISQNMNRTTANGSR